MVDDPISQKNRKSKQKDHPGTIKDSFYQFGQKDIAQRNGQGKNQLEVIGKVIGRKGGNDITEY